MCISLLFAGTKYLTNNIKGEDWFEFMILGHLAQSHVLGQIITVGFCLHSVVDRKWREKRIRDRTSPRTQPCALLPLAVLNTLGFSEFHSILPTKDQTACGDLNCNTWVWDWHFIFRPSHSVVKTYIDFLHSLCFCFVCFMFVWLVLGTLNSFGVDKKLILLY